MMRCLLLLAVALTVYLSASVLAENPGLTSNKAKYSLLREVVKSLLQEKEEAEENNLLTEKELEEDEEKSMLEQKEEPEKNSLLQEKEEDEQNNLLHEQEKPEENSLLQEREEENSMLEQREEPEKNSLLQEGPEEKEDDEQRSLLQDDPEKKYIYHAHHVIMHHPMIHHHPALYAMYWPEGTYGLLMPKKTCISKSIGHTPSSSCPHGHWATGWRYHDTNDHVNYNEITPNSCLEGAFSRSGIRWDFCTQLDRSGLHRPHWPRGSYCLFKKGSCPYGFQYGKVKFDDEDSGNANRHSGVLPDGTYNTNTIYEFCCRTDGSVHTPIHLPTDVPFYLIGSTPSCQAVYGMRVREETIFFDCENHANNNYRSGQTPYDFGHRSNHKFHLCYYER